MGFIEKARGIFSPVLNGVVKPSAVSLPVQMQWRFLGDQQVVWFPSDGNGLIENAYLGNHVIWTIQDWKASKVASAPPLLYKIKDDKKYRKYRSLMKDVNHKNFSAIHELKLKSLEEIDEHAILNVLKNPNPHMSGYEFFYGHTVYKDIVGSSYFMGVRNGIEDEVTGEIKEMWLPPAHQMMIVSGGLMNPVAAYKLQGSDKEINAKNVLQLRHFSPRFNSPLESLYGMSRVFSARGIIQEYNEGTTLKTGVNQNKGVRALIFPKGSNDIGMIEATQAREVQDHLNNKLAQTGNGGIMASNVEIGVVNIGFTPEQLGVLNSQKETKKDLCALYKVSPIILDWTDHGTFNNLSESRKISLTDAVLPELEILKNGLNSWLLPSYTKDKDYVIDFDDEYYAELQEDKAEQAKWMAQAPLTANERREIFGYDRINDVNADKAIVPSNFQLLESMGTESFGDANQDVVNGTFGEEKP